MNFFQKLNQIFKPAHIRKFVTILHREGASEAFRRASYFLRLILFDTTHSETRLDGTADEIPTTLGRFFPFWIESSKGDGFHVTTHPLKRSRTRRLAIIGDLNLPQCRKYRVEQLPELWEGAGADVEYAHHEDFPRSAAILQRATHVLFYRLKAQDTTLEYLYEARRLCLPVAYDIDDPLFSVSAYQNYRAAQTFDRNLLDHFLREAPRYAAFMNACDIVSVSTPKLKELAKRNTQRPVYVRRNFADAQSLLSGHRAIQESAHHKSMPHTFTFAIATGSTGRSADFKEAFEALSAALQKNMTFQVKIIGHYSVDDIPPKLRKSVTIIPFSSYEDYLRHLAIADCALIPMADDLFNQCKSGVRLIDANSAGIPAILSQVGDSKFLVEPNISGFLIDEMTDWLDAIEFVIANPNKVAKMGVAARRHIEKRWTASLSEHIIEKEYRDWFLS